MKLDPFEILGIPDPADWPKDANPYFNILDYFVPENLNSVLKLMQSDDQYIIGRGLYLFGELGKRAFSLLDYALRFTSHPDAMARNALMNGIMCYCERLTPEQAQQVLSLAEDSNKLVHHKVIVFIGAANTEIIFEAIQQISDKEMRLKHMECFEATSSEIDDVQHLFDEALTYPPMLSTYALASIERAARNKQITTAPSYSGNDYIGECVAANTKRIIRNNLRENRKN